MINSGALILSAVPLGLNGLYWSCIIYPAMNHRATLRGSYGTIPALKLRPMPWRGPPIFKMGDPFRVISLQHYPPHGLASRVPRDYYREVPSGLPKTSFVSILVGKRTRPLLVALPFFDEHCMKIRNHQRPASPRFTGEVCEVSLRAQRSNLYSRTGSCWCIFA